MDIHQVEAALKGYIEPALECDLVSAKSVKNINLKGDTVSIELSLGFPAKRYAETLSDQLEIHLRKQLPALQSIDVSVSSKILSHAVQRNLKPMPGIKNIIAVASGKGGVGKSTTAVNLALALISEGARVGLLDADIYGPSQPRMLGYRGRPSSKDGKIMEPVERFGIQSMSVGYLVEEETPMIWRGPMVTQALNQLLNDTNWQNIDYLVVDLPPGTGDAQLTLSQKIPVSGAVIVTTPQDIALLDARKAYRMFEKVEVPVLGVVENMSTHICSQCGYEEHIFGQGGGERMAAQYELPYLGSLPLDIRIREEADSGCPTVEAQPDSELADRYREIARKTTAQLALQGRDYSAAFPKIVVEDS